MLCLLNDFSQSYFGNPIGVLVFESRRWFYRSFWISYCTFYMDTTSKCQQVVIVQNEVKYKSHTVIPIQYFTESSPLKGASAHIHILNPPSCIQTKSKLNNNNIGGSCHEIQSNRSEQRKVKHSVPPCDRTARPSVSKRKLLCPSPQVVRAQFQQNQQSDYKAHRPHHYPIARFAAPLPPQD